MGGRALVVWWFRAGGGGVAPDGPGARSRGATVRRRGAVRASPRGAQSGATRQPGHASSCCRSGWAASSSSGFTRSRRTCWAPLRSRSATTRRHVSHRHPAGPGGRRERPARGPARTGTQLSAGPACASDRSDGAADHAGERAGGAAARCRARVHGHVSGPPRGQRTCRGGRLLGARTVGPGGGVGRGECARATGSGARRHDPIRHPGREIRATVSSVRTVDWDDSRSGGFMFLFRPGVLEQAPHGAIAFVRGRPRRWRGRVCSGTSLRGSPTCRS